MDKQLIERIAPLVLAAIDQSLAFPSPSEKIAISESITALVIARIDVERGKESAIPPLAYGLPGAAADVIAERNRQQIVEGWTPKHDDYHSDGQMVKTAACYALSSVGFSREALYNLLPRDWLAWLKPTTTRRDLVKAGALILAEIERIDRAAAQGERK